jgi:hemerythrin-like domain-containing protein
MLEKACEEIQTWRDRAIRAEGQLVDEKAAKDRAKNSLNERERQIGKYQQRLNDMYERLKDSGILKRQVARLEAEVAQGQETMKLLAQDYEEATRQDKEGSERAIQEAVQEVRVPCAKENEKTIQDAIQRTLNECAKEHESMAQQAVQADREQVVGELQAGT